MSDLKWGVLSTALIGMNKVIPGIQNSRGNTVYAIASRNSSTAAEAAEKAGIPVSYGSYEELLSDKNIDVIYIPLPNHMHVEWSIKAMEAGKHVLCEKPIALCADDIRKMKDVSQKTGKIISEAFMVKHHPQWQAARQVVQNGTLGELKAIQGAFSYYNRDEGNIRNIPEYGGGGILDIGCYPVVTSRYIFNEEPLRVIALLERDPEFRIDRLGSVIMEFSSGQASFVCSTQLVPFQRMNIMGTKGRLEVEIPFNAPPDRKTHMYLSKGEFYQEENQLLDFEICDQYGLQAESFERTVRDGDELLMTLEDSIRNMNVLEAIFRSAESGRFETV